MILHKASAATTLAAQPLLEAFDAPACLISLHGAMLAANAAWRSLVGDASRPPKAWNLYPVLNAARRGGRGEAEVTLGERRFCLRAISLPGGRFLLRLEDLAAKADPG